MKRRILFTLGTVQTGAERVVQTIARQLDKKKYEHSFCTLSLEDNFQAILKEVKPDVVFCSQIHLALKVADEVCLHEDIELVFRCNYMLQDVSEDIARQAASAYPRAKMVIAQTAAMRNQLLESFDLDPEKVIVYHNPVDVEHITALAGSVSPYPDDGCAHFVWVGRFDPIKDLDTLLKAFAIVHRQNRNTSLYLVGDCPNPQAYQQDGVYLVGYQSNPYPWMKYADCFVLSSKSEACPNVLLEASALGTPIITTRSFDNKEYRLNNCSFIKKGDDKSLLRNMHVLSGCIINQSSRL